MQTVSVNIESSKLLIAPLLREQENSERISGKQKQNSSGTISSGSSLRRSVLHRSVWWKRARNKCLQMRGRLRFRFTLILLQFKIKVSICCAVGSSMLTVDVIVFLPAQTLHLPQNEKGHKRIMDIACTAAAAAAVGAGTRRGCSLFTLKNIRDH